MLSRRTTTPRLDRFCAWLAAAIIALALAHFVSGPAQAEPAPPVLSDLVDVVEFGIFCRPRIEGQAEAPGTSQGYINLLETTPVIRFPQQQVPAALNVSFGLNYIPQFSANNLRMETWIPGREGPDIWFTSYTAGDSKNRGFTFEFPEELVIGLWRLEAWDGETLIYSIEFEVVPAGRFPDIVEYCNPIA